MILKKYNLFNKTALITGAGKGLGKVCAISLAEAGADIIILSRTKKDLDLIVNKTKKIKRRCTAFVCDVTNYNEVEKLFKKIKKLDILINNAGTNIPSHFTKIKRKDMNYVVDLNLKAAFNIAQKAAKIMLKSKNRKKIGGSIINMSSQLGHVGAPMRSVYSMTKFGIEGLTKGMAIDLAKSNIRVNTICPTFVETPMVKEFFKDKKFKSFVLNNIPLGRLAKEIDVANAIVFLSSNASSMITGSSLIIDGGWTAK
tara:strand:+ start:1691 stop:2458 length:768 start_codon:yes stop_codon:yes gene_type:complete